MTTRLEPKIRKARILSAAMIVAERDGFTAMTRNAIAEQADVAPSLVNQYFVHMDRVKNEVMRRAVKYKILPIILDGIVARNRIALTAPTNIKVLAAQLLLD